MNHPTDENQILPTGLPMGTPQEALDCACDLYLGHWPRPTPDELRGKTTKLPGMAYFTAQLGPPRI